MPTQQELMDSAAGLTLSIAGLRRELTTQAARRDQLWADLRQAGVSISRIARECDVTRRDVQRSLARTSV